MTKINPELRRQIDEVAADRQSGASQILERAIAILREAYEAEDDVLEVGRALIQAQPAMAPLWNAVLAAVPPQGSAARLDNFAHRVGRTPAAIARYAAELIDGDVVTLSFSGTVASVLESLGRTRRLGVACGEGRPALEGRRMAQRLAAAGIAVTFYTDAALAQALSSARAMVIGADAIGPDWVVNKSGTHMLAAAAAHVGVPVYVLAGRDKFLGTGLARHLRFHAAAPGEVWDAPPPGVEVRNAYFEPTPLDLVTGVITDAGVLGSAMVADVCAAQDERGWERLT